MAKTRFLNDKPVLVNKASLKSKLAMSETVMFMQIQAEIFVRILRSFRAFVLTNKHSFYYKITGIMKNIKAIPCFILIPSEMWHKFLANMERDILSS